MRTVSPRRQVMSGLIRADDGERGEQAAATMAAEVASGADGKPLLFAFLHGHDTEPRPMSPDEIRDLGDIFSQRIVLTAPSAPLTLGDLIQAIGSGTGPPLPIRKMFLVDEGAMAHQEKSAARCSSDGHAL